MRMGIHSHTPLHLLQIAFGAEQTPPKKTIMKAEIYVQQHPHRGEKAMPRKKTFSTMEIILLIFLISSLITAFLQARREETE